MTRRELLASIGLVPALPVATAISVEPQIAAGDLVVLSCPCTIDHDTATRLYDSVKHNLPDHARVLILGDGMTLQVHRGIARVETPHG